MRRTPKLALYAGLASASFVAALALGRPELVGLGAPFALVLVAGLALAAPEPVRAGLRLRSDTALEGGQVDGELVIEGPRRSRELQLAHVLPPEVALVEGAERPLLRQGAGRSYVIPLRLSCSRWGVYELGRLVVRVRDETALRSLDQRLAPSSVVRVYPRPDALRTLVRPWETQPFAGNWVARTKSEGIEFADVRPYEPGDRVRRVNWRESSRRQVLHVNQQHPERDSDVILFIDSFSEARHEQGGTLDLAVRAAASLASHYLQQRDRVGLVSFGGFVRWLVPSSGARQAYRIVEALLETEISLSFAWKEIDVLPARSLTPQALVIALSPLLDERGVRALLDLRRRGFDLVVVELSPIAFARRPEAEPDLAIRLWRLWREALRFRYERLGVAVVEWDGEQPLAVAVEEVRAFRRFARFASGS
jgi:uncharacterized protein (DUF58 family)